MNKKQKKTLVRIIISVILLAVIHFIPVENRYIKLAIYLIPYFVIGYDILIKAFKGIKNRQPLDECLLMVIATIGAMVMAVINNDDYLEGVAVMLFYQIGEWFQSYAVGKSRRNISELMDIRPDYANIMGENGELEKADPDEIEIGTVIYVKPGEKVPIDGIVVEGSSTLNTAALTGESRPRDVAEGDEIISGCINESALLKIRTTKEFCDSTVSKILDLVENASMRKSSSEDFISRFARVYTPVVVISALVLAVLPPFATLLFGGNPEFGTWIYRALTFLVISCPCALVVSIPLSFFAGIGGASKKGVLVKGSNYLEALSRAETVLFDKTGTLTKGVFEVVAAYPVGISEEELFHMAAHAERYSTHPIALSLKAKYNNENDDCSVENVREISGHGIRAEINGREVCVGNAKMMNMLGIEYTASELTGTIVHVVIDNKYAGHIVISDVEKPESEKAISELKKLGVRKTIMLTGDSNDVARAVAEKLKLDSFYSELLPADKVTKVEEIIENTGKNRKVVFVGDGINDAPVLTRADIGIAMGAMGSDAAIEAADVVLMDDNPESIVKAIRISRKTNRIVKENIYFAIGIKVACLILGALGITNMWAAIFADVGVMVIAVLNAIRALF